MLCVLFVYSELDSSHADPLHTRMGMSGLHATLLHFFSFPNMGPKWYLQYTSVSPALEDFRSP